MAKSIGITVHFSTNPDVAGRYFLDMRDTSNGQNRQMTTRTADRDEIVKFVADASSEAPKHGVAVKVTDTTREIEIN